MVDGETVAEIIKGGHAIGQAVSISLGGKCDPKCGGGPLSLCGVLKHISPTGAYTGSGPMYGGLNLFFGPTVVLEVQGIDILVVTDGEQILDLMQFQAFGIDPCSKHVVALKSMQHFRAAFTEIAGEIIVCDSGALCTPNLQKLEFLHCTRPIFPLDYDMTFDRRGKT